MTSEKKREYQRQWRKSNAQKVKDYNAMYHLGGRMERIKNQIVEDYDPYNCIVMDVNEDGRAMLPISDLLSFLNKCGVNYVEFMQGNQLGISEMLKEVK